jgi:hypothetical protein
VSTLSDARDAPYRPQLDRLPDARRGAVPILDPVLLGYVALMLGSAVAGLLALYNAVVLRRPRLALIAVGTGAAGWVAFGAAAVAMIAAGLDQAAPLLLVARLLSLGFGILLAWSQWASARGHRFLAGPVVALLPSLLVALALTFVLPWRTQLLMQGFWLLLFDRG